MKLIKEVAKSWRLIWSIINAPKVGVGEVGYLKLRGMLIFIERVK